MSFWQFLQQNWLDVLGQTQRHLALVLISVSIAVSIGVPVGILASRKRWLKSPVLGIANVMQTVPSLALFGILIPLPFIGGIGARTAIVALVLYALLPVIRNTITGIASVDRNVREAAVAMGMTDLQILWQVELPLATSVILTGVRVAAVISVGVATIAAIIGAEGLGVYIFRGLRQYDDNLLLAGAVPAALMALGVDLIIGFFDRALDRTKSRSTSAWLPRKVVVPASIVLLIGCALLVGYNLREGGLIAQDSSRPQLVIGSKDFTESILLGEILAQMLESRDVDVVRQFELGGTLPHTSLLSGKIDAYPEYTGTAFTAILKHKPISDPHEVYERVKREYAEEFNVHVGPGLGFRNDFAILVRGDVARRLNLKTISDAVPHARRWRAAFGQDFMSREDGYAGFVRTYEFNFASRPREMDLALTYRALAAGQVDIIAGNSTDGLIAALDLVQLEDDRNYFPPYEAVFVIRTETISRIPAAQEVLDQLAGAISTEEMRTLNNRIDGENRDRRQVVREWLQSKGLLTNSTESLNWSSLSAGTRSRALDVCRTFAVDASEVSA